MLYKKYIENIKGLLWLFSISHLENLILKKLLSEFPDKVKEDYKGKEILI